MIIKTFPVTILVWIPAYAGMTWVINQCFLKENSRKLRSQLTDAEQMLWQRLRMRQMLGKKFRRQHPCGGYILDFACVELKIAIELDGGQHSTTIDYDSKRSAWLSTQGWLVLRQR